MTHFKALRDCFLFQRSSAELPRSRKIWHQIWNWGFVVLLGIGLGVFSLLLACCNRGYEVFWGYFQSPMILLLNLLPPVLLMAGLYAATGRAWIAWLVSSLLMLIPPAVNLYVVSFRDDPFTVTELLLMREGLTIAANYTIELEARTWACIIAIPVVTVLLFFFVRGRNRWRPRLIVGLAVLLSLAPLSVLYTSDTVYSDYTWNYEHLTEKRSTERFIGKGYWYPFFHSLGEMVVPEDEAPGNASVEINESGEASVTLQPTTPPDEEPIPTVSFEPGEIPEEKQVDVIMVMLEAFSDLTDLGIEGIYDDVYAGWHALEAESYSGRLVTNIFAAGTVNTERCVLTGDLWVPDDGYAQPTGSYVRYLADQGYTVTGSHPIYGWFYDRQSINQHLGFRDYRFWEERYQFQVSDVAQFLYRDDLFFQDVFDMYLAGTNRQWGLAEDGTQILVPYFPESEPGEQDLLAALPPELQAQLQTEAASGEDQEAAEIVYTEPLPLYYPPERTPYFGFHVSYQGHATYNDSVIHWGNGREYYSRTPAETAPPEPSEPIGQVDAYSTAEAYTQALEAQAAAAAQAQRAAQISDASYYILNNYLGSICDTIEQIVALRDRLAAQEEPVVLVLFGDHKPWLGDGNSVYKELGVNLNTDTEEGFYNFYSTPYLIWANDAAKETLGNDFTGEGPTISPAYLMNELFRLCGWDGPAYMKLMDALQPTLPVVNTDGYYVAAGQYTDELSDAQQRALDSVRQMADFRRTHVGDIKIVTEELP